MHTFLYMRFYEHGVMYFKLYTRSSTREAALLPFVDIHMINRELAKTSARYYGAKASFGGVDTHRQTSCIVEFQCPVLIFGASQSQIPRDFGCETDPLQHPRSTLRKVGNPLFASHLRRIRSIVSPVAILSRSKPASATSDKSDSLLCVIRMCMAWNAVSDAFRIPSTPRYRPPYFVKSFVHAMVYIVTLNRAQRTRKIRDTHSRAGLGHPSASWCPKSRLSILSPFAPLSIPTAHRQTGTGMSASLPRTPCSFLRPPRSRGRCRTCSVTHRAAGICSRTRCVDGSRRRSRALWGRALRSLMNRVEYSRSLPAIP